MIAYPTIRSFSLATRKVSGFFRANSASNHQGYGSLKDNCSNSNIEDRCSSRNGTIASTLAGFIMLSIACFLRNSHERGGHILATHGYHVRPESRAGLGPNQYAVQCLEQFTRLKPVLPRGGE